MNDLAPDTDVWSTIAPQLTRLQKKFPLEALRLAEAHWDEVAPHLAAALEAIAADPEPARDGYYMLHLFAAHLLAQHRDPRAHSALLRLARLPEETLEEVAGDTVNENLSRMLASTCGGGDSGIRALIEDESASIWARIAGFGALATRVLEGDASREATLEYLARLGAAEQARLAADAKRDPMFLTSVVNAATDIGAAPLLPSIRRWFADGLVDETVVDLHFVEAHAHDDLDALRRLNSHHHYVCSTIEEMQDWAFERPERPTPAPHFDPEINRYGEPLRLPQVRETPKVGRNDPCPCGSGKKYKKCCGA